MQRLIMTPVAGERLQRFIGDTIRFSLKFTDSTKLLKGWRGFLRTNLGRGTLLREEILQAHFRKIPLAGAAWRDIPMPAGESEWILDLTLAEVGFFRSKAYAIDQQGRQCWPEGGDFGLSIHPDACRTGNTLYCAFPRLFGPSRFKTETLHASEEQLFKNWDSQGYTIIPPSGKLRDLTAQLPHIIDRLGCKIIHLLPINPTPTVYARYGRFGSPYAVQDLAAIDLSLIEYDKKTTAVDQFLEFTFATHLRGAKIFLDVVINHTGWGSSLMENHPEWFVREKSDGTFVSPGAWGTIWEDLVELDHHFPALWDHLADVFITWCRRGVDGFRCDAGYKVPARVWQYITTKVQSEFPEAVFFLEGLGGAWEATESLLTEGGMQWAYSELFQNYTPLEISEYLRHSFKQSERVGTLVHYSETHDNDRMAKKGKVWSLLRNQLSGLTSQNGAFGFTCGVEWLATEKIRVHGCTGLNWDASDNISHEIARLNHLLTEHPCFFDHATINPLSPPENPVYAAKRVSAEGQDHVLVLINTDSEKAQHFSLPAPMDHLLGEPWWDLLTQTQMMVTRVETKVLFQLNPGQSVCLANQLQPRGLHGEEYRQMRAQAAFAIQACHALRKGDLHGVDWKYLAGLVHEDPIGFLSAIRRMEWENWPTDFSQVLGDELRQENYTSVVTWKRSDARRVTLVPSGHWLLVQDVVPFQAALFVLNEPTPIRIHSVPWREGYVAAFPARTDGANGRIELERYTSNESIFHGQLRFLAPTPTLDFPELVGKGASAQANDEPDDSPFKKSNQGEARRKDALALFTNGLGGMARICVDLGNIQSKYDCLLGANLHPSLPVDRHILVKRVRAWLNADGFITPLNWENLLSFEAGPPGSWRFLANSGDGRSVEVNLAIDMLEGYNATVLQFSRPFHAPATGKDLPDSREVKLVLRFDIEDRNFHSETKYNGGAEHHFASHTHTSVSEVGFSFTPGRDRQLHITSNAGAYHAEPEWCRDIPHPIEQSRGQEIAGDAFSPGWFEIPLKKGSHVTVTASAELHGLAAETISGSRNRREAQNQKIIQASGLTDPFGQRLCLSSAAFVVRRGEGKTVIAGYPWFLDWGRDTFICARGLLAAGRTQEVLELVRLFGRFEKLGTLPNTIHGEDASNRDTSDAPLWYAIVCEEMAAISGPAFYHEKVSEERTIRDVLISIAENYWRGTSNGIHADPDSGFIWSPAHFTWMDTNYPAATPRQGYPIEIQALWFRLLKQLHGLNVPRASESWGALATRVEAKILQRYWLEKEGYMSDCLHGSSGTRADDAVRDTALRSNYLFTISLGLLKGPRAQRAVQAAIEWLVIPGALRSLAPLPVNPPLPVHGADGRLLNDPAQPYRGRYLGDEDTLRKPAYHNGTAWSWTFPVFCEALAEAWHFEPAAVHAARSYLGSMEQLLSDHCIGHLAEIFDGDAPHVLRGCDAQAWGATEALRVWKLLERRS